MHDDIALSLQKTLCMWTAVYKTTTGPVVSHRGRNQFARNMQIFSLKTSELVALLTKVWTIKLQHVASDRHKQ